MRFRRFNKAYANSMGYFWLPCPLCGQFFGGHEWETGEGDAHSIPIEGRPNTRTGICPDCGYKRETEMKLKPCPFCGKIPKVGNSLGRFLVSCINQKCQMYSVSTKSYDTEVEAITIWNRRVK